MNPNSITHSHTCTMHTEPTHTHAHTIHPPHLDLTVISSWDYEVVMSGRTPSWHHGHGPAEQVQYLLYIASACTCTVQLVTQYFDHKLLTNPPTSNTCLTMTSEVPNNSVPEPGFRNVSTELLLNGATVFFLSPETSHTRTVWSRLADATRSSVGWNWAHITYWLWPVRTLHACVCVCVIWIATTHYDIEAITLKDNIWWAHTKPRNGSVETTTASKTSQTRAQQLFFFW